MNYIYNSVNSNPKNSTHSLSLDEKMDFFTIGKGYKKNRGSK